MGVMGLLDVRAFRYSGDVRSQGEEGMVTDLKEAWWAAELALRAAFHARRPCPSGVARADTSRATTHPDGSSGASELT